MTRSLHNEAARYDVCWPVMVERPVVIPKFDDLRGRTRAQPSRDVVLSVMSRELQNVRSIAELSGYAWKTTQDLLWLLERAGRVEVIMQPMTYRGRPQRLYRLAASPVGKGRPNR